MIHKNDFVCSGYLVQGYRRWEIQVSLDGNSARYILTERYATKDKIYHGRWQKVHYTKDTCPYIVARCHNIYQRLYLCHFLGTCVVL